MNKLIGRRRRTAVERERLAAEYRQSGLSVAGFARRLGVTPPTVYQWLRAGRAAPAMVPVRIRPGGPEWLRLVRPDGWRIEFPRELAATELRQLVEGLGGC
jgi:transposase-like protein